MRRGAKQTHNSGRFTTWTRWRDLTADAQCCGFPFVVTPNTNQHEKDEADTRKADPYFTTGQYLFNQHGFAVVEIFNYRFRRVRSR